MDYSKKANEIYKAIEDLKRVKYQFPLLNEMIRRKELERWRYYHKIHENIFLYGSSPLKFKDIDYNPFTKP